jgi:hypothetical protein
MTETNDRATAVRAAIERWFHDNLANSPVSRSVEAINHLRASLDALAAEIATTFTKET